MNHCHCRVLVLAVNAAFSSVLRVLVEHVAGLQGSCLSETCVWFCLIFCFWAAVWREVAFSGLPPWYLLLSGLGLSLSLGWHCSLERLPAAVSSRDVCSSRLLSAPLPEALHSAPCLSKLVVTKGMWFVKGFTPFLWPVAGLGADFHCYVRVSWIAWGYSE